MHAGEKPTTRDRDAIPSRFKFDLTRIYADWDAWEADLARFEQGIERLVALRGSLASGPDAVAAAYRVSDELGVTHLRLYRHAHLSRDTDSCENSVNARLQRVQTAAAQLQTATAWFRPELLEIPWTQMASWIDSTPELTARRFPISEEYRQRSHTLPEEQERLLSFATRLGQTPAAIYRELSTSDVRFPTITLKDGSERVLSPATYASMQQTCRDQSDRARAFEAFYGVFAGQRNAYAAIYNAVLQRGWFQAQARGYASTLEAALDGKNIPVAVFETLIRTARAGVEPLRRYHRLRKRLLGLDEYHVYDGSIPIIETSRRFTFEQTAPAVVESVARLGHRYQEEMRRLLSGGWIDVFENTGKRSGAYSASVYGVGPYVLLNYNDTLNDAFTLAHEMGHSMHTVSSNEAQPWATANYTIFVAEVASTLNEALFLDFMMARTDDPRDRAALLQRQIDAITHTFFAQVLFADFEWQAHQRVEAGAPITAELLGELFLQLQRDYHGDAVTPEPLSAVTWARISHFYEAPYYVYQYATCYASSAQIYLGLSSADPEVRRDAVGRYLELLQSGGSDHPMEQLRRAGVDLTRSEPIEAVVRDLGRLVDEYEQTVEALVPVPQH